MKRKSPRFFVTSAVASVVVLSAAAAIYVSAVSDTVASGPVTPLDLSSPSAVQAALEFDPFDLGNAVSDADLGQGGVEAFVANIPSPDTGAVPTSADDAPPASVDHQPTDTLAAATDNTPTAESSGEKALIDAAGGEAQAGVQKGAIDAAKTGGKMNFGIGAAVAGVAVAGAGGATLGVVLSEDSKTIIRSPSTP